MTYITKFANVQITGNLDTAGNITTTGNVSANNETLASNITIGNLQILNTSDGNTEISQTTGGDLTIGSGTISLVSPNLVLGAVANIHISGNVPAANGAAIYLSSDGNGNLSWGIPQGVGNGVVGGNITQIQYNNGNGFGGTDSMTYIANYISNLDGVVFTSGVVTYGSNTSNTQILAGNVISFGLPTAANVFIPGGAPGQVLTATGTNGEMLWEDNGVKFPGGPNNSIQFNAGNNNFNGTGNLLFADDSNGGVLSIGTNSVLSFAGNGIMTVASGSNFTLPAIANVKLEGGANNFVMKTDGSGNLFWAVSTYYNTQTIPNAGPFTPDPLVDDMAVFSYDGNVSVILPPASTQEVGAYLIIKDSLGPNRANNPITVTVNGGGYIDGLASVEVNGPYNSITVACINNTTWGRI
jgi:hypothetical protein